MELDDARLTVLEFENLIVRFQKFDANSFKVGISHGEILNGINVFKKSICSFCRWVNVSCTRRALFHSVRTK